VQTPGKVKDNQDIDVSDVSAPIENTTVTFMTDNSSDYLNHHQTVDNATNWSSNGVKVGPLHRNKVVLTVVAFLGF
jgi:hypothetical protein